jgi:transglutaminase-like putative cysteine protease
MRLRIAHETRYSYTMPPKGIIQTLRLTPRNHDGQYIVDWRIDVDRNCRLQPVEDAFGNIMHTFTIEEPLNALIIAVEGEVETLDSGGLLKGTAERFPPEFYLRETALTCLNPVMVDYARNEAEKSGTDPLERLHDLLKALNRDIAFDANPTHSGTTAAQSFELKKGVCQDLSHIFIAMARGLGIPARYVSGYFFRSDGRNDQEAGHAWTEVCVPDLGWVGFDPTNGISTTDAYVRVATGLDYLGAAPVRGSRYGGGKEVLDVRVIIQTR